MAEERSQPQTEPKGRVRKALDSTVWKLFVEGSAMVTAGIAICIYLNIIPDKLVWKDLADKLADSTDAQKELSTQLAATKETIRLAGTDRKPTPLEQLATMRVLAAPYAQRVEWLRRQKQGVLSKDEYVRQYTSVRGGNPAELMVIANQDEKAFVTEIGVTWEAWGKLKEGRGIEFLAGQDVKGAENHLEWFGDMVSSPK